MATAKSNDTYELQYLQVARLLQYNFQLQYCDNDIKFLCHMDKTNSQTVTLVVL